MPRNTPNTPTAAEQIRSAAAALGWPEAFPGDLEIDVDFLDSQNPPIFVWHITCTGTHLMLGADMVRCVQRATHGRQGRLYLYSKGKLRPATWEDACEQLRAATEHPMARMVY
jgi:hypothetical protein